MFLRQITKHTVHDRIPRLRLGFPNSKPSTPAAALGLSSGKGTHLPGLGESNPSIGFPRLDLRGLAFTGCWFVLSGTSMISGFPLVSC